MPFSVGGSRHKYINVPFAFYYILFWFYWLFPLFFFVHISWNIDMPGCLCVFMSQISFCQVAAIPFSEWMLFKKGKNEECDTEKNIQYRLSGIMVASYSKMFPIIIERFAHCCLIAKSVFFCVAVATRFVCNLIRSLCSLKSQTHKRNPVYERMNPAAIFVTGKKGPISNKNTFRISHIYCRLWAFIRIIMQRFKSLPFSASMHTTIVCVWVVVDVCTEMLFLRMQTLFSIFIYPPLNVLYTANHCLNWIFDAHIYLYFFLFSFLFAGKCFNELGRVKFHQFIGSWS